MCIFKIFPGCLPQGRPAGTSDTSHWPRYHCPKYSEIDIKCVVVLLVKWPKNVYYSLPKLDVSLKPYGNCALFPFFAIGEELFFLAHAPIAESECAVAAMTSLVAGHRCVRTKESKRTTDWPTTFAGGYKRVPAFLLGDGLPTFIVGADWPGIGPGRFKWQCQPVGLRVAWYRRNKIVMS